METSIGHQSPGSSLPPLIGKTVNTKVWLTTGNTDVVVDPYIFSNSFVDIVPTSSFTGPWWITMGEGTFTVNSANSENSGTTYSYIIL